MGRKRPPQQTDIRINCPVCGVVDVQLGQVNVLLRNTGEGNAILFRCSGCLDMIEASGLSKHTTCVLMAAGVLIIDQTIECLTYPSRPALTERDAEAFEKSIEHMLFLASFARRESQQYRRELLDAQ